MTAVDAVLARLEDIAALVALVPATRHYALIFPQNVSELGNAIRVTLVDRLQQMHLRGASALCRARIQIDIAARATSGTDPFSAASAIFDAMHGPGDGTGLCAFQGDVSSSPSIPIRAILPDPAGPRVRFDADELRMVVISHDYFVWYEE